MARGIKISPARALRGTVAIPGDKSLSHRSIMLAGLADTPVTVKNFLASADCLSTVACMRALGVSVHVRPDGDVIVQARDSMDSVNRIMCWTPATRGRRFVF